GVLFYRAHWMSGNLEFIDCFVDTLAGLNADVLPVFTASLKETALPNWTGAVTPWPTAFNLLCDEHGPVVDVILSTLSFAMNDGRHGAAALEALDVPILQAITAGTSREQWEASPRGLGPLDTAINVALPEFDGRVITVPTSFKELFNPEETCKLSCAGSCMDATGGDGISAGPGEIIRYAPALDRVEVVGRLALRFAALRHKPNAEKRVAFILTNNAGKANRVGNAVGLDAPASLMEL